MPNKELYPRAVAKFYENNCAASNLYLAEDGLRKHWLQSHRFRPAADLCTDGRVSCFSDALGLPKGILEEYRSPGSKTGLACGLYLARLMCDHNRARYPQRNEASVRMAIMHFVTFHFSGTHPSYASCSEWEHKIGLAFGACQKHATELNHAFSLDLVAFPAGIDTDNGAVTICSSRGQLAAAECLNIPDEELSQVMVKRLHELFPASQVFDRLRSAVFLDSFHTELAERLVANVSFVRQGLASPTTPKELTHREKLIFVGRHANWLQTEDQDSVFLVDDTMDHGELAGHFAEALKHVTRTLVLEAQNNGLTDWQVPVIVNVPFDCTEHVSAMMIHVRHLVDVLKCEIIKSEDNIRSWILNDLRREMNEVPPQVSKELRNLRDRIYFAPSVSDRKTGLFIPFDL